MSHPPALIIHGHFYQPPRENPWTGIVDREPSAAPLHDWNERIYGECYRPNGWARMFDERGAVVRIVNNYEQLSYNFGPTLLRWLEIHHRRGYRRIIEADRFSARRRHGHGNAIAQGYNHAILPLCNDRDLTTQVRWGLFEFRHRYGRDAEALWMPETACDDRTLGVLIDEGLRYALLAPGQAARVKTSDGWRDVSDGSIDPRQPYRYLHPDGSGRSIALFFYDGAISRAIAFEGALASSQALIERCERASGGAGTLVHAVTDGESYGHHHKFGDRCLAHALTREAQKRGFWVTNYGELLDEHPAEMEVEISKGDDGMGSSWSCAHGVGRWYRDCGCHTGGKAGWTQAWRKPLRDALDGLRDEAASLYEERMGELAADPWALRDAYVELVVDPRADRDAFFERHLGKRLDSAKQLQALRLLESQRSSMLMYTSCGWFFSDLSGIETVQIMRYAGRLVDQLSELGIEGSSERLVERLAEAHSNVAAKGSGADLYRAEVAPTSLDAAKLAAHISLAGLPRDVPSDGELASYRFRLAKKQQARSGRITLSTMHIELEQLATGAESAFASCALHFGGVDLHCVLKPYPGDDAYTDAVERLWAAFGKGSLLTLLRVAEEEMGPDDYGLDTLLPSVRNEVSQALFEELRERYAAQYEAMYQDARLSIAQFHEAGLPIPQELSSAAQLALAYRFDEEIARAPVTSFDRRDFEGALAIAAEAERYGCELRRDAACRHFESMLLQIVHRVCAGATDEEHAGSSPVQNALALIATAVQLGLELNLVHVQERLVAALDLGLPVSEELDELLAAVGVGREAKAAE